tara:strand:+ start:197 stop:502 length:306 start_codon:yes stop_codon:yes gene_type:complete
MEITKRRKERLSILVRYLDQYEFENNSSPSLKEIMHHIGTKGDGYVRDLVKQAQHLGLVERSEKHRSIRLVRTKAERIEFLKAQIARLEAESKKPTLRMVR